tara:strand:+ start:110 stop:703 length:594 start_codon:yes stop_codon:yes gene_type:complete
MIKNKFYLFILLITISGCMGTSSTGVLGTGVSIATDPRTIGTQIDDNIMQKNLSARIINRNAKYLFAVKPKVIDGRIFITGKVNTVEEKLNITKLAWETKGARSVKNDLKIREQFDIQQFSKDILITSQLRTVMIASKTIKSTNYNIDTYKKKIYIYGIAESEEERSEVINEAKQILDVEDVISSILLIEDLRVIKN